MNEKGATKTQPSSPYVNPRVENKRKPNVYAYFPLRVCRSVDYKTVHHCKIVQHTKIIKQKKQCITMEKPKNPLSQPQGGK